MSIEKINAEDSASAPVIRGLPLPNISTLLAKSFDVSLIKRYNKTTAASGSFKLPPIISN